MLNRTKKKKKSPEEQKTRSRKAEGLQQRRAQSLLEYVTLVGVVIAILIAMTTHVKRGIQMMVKIVADQIGCQQLADQKKDSVGGYLKNAITIGQSRLDTEIRETPGLVNYIFRDYTKTDSLTIMNGGFTKKDNRV